MTRRFTVEGPPVTWKRARRGKGHSYTDPLAARHMESIRAAARNAGCRTPSAGPMHLRFTVYVAGCEAISLRSGDLDNHEKIIKDALSAIVWNDDRQVVHVEKWKARDDGWPRTEIEVRVEAMEASAAHPKLPRTSAFGASCRVPLRQDDAADSRAQQRRITGAANVTRSSVRKFR